MIISAETSGANGLRSRHLSFSQVLASSLGVMGISGSVVIMVPLIFASAGNGTCLAVAIAVLAYILVAFQINVFARRIATVGSLYVYVQQGLGPLAGTVVGWALFLGYWGFVPVNIVAVSYYLLLFARNLMKIAPAMPPLTDVAVVACGVTALAWWLTYRGVKLSSRVILFIECATISLIAVVIGGYFLSKGLSIDSAQLGLKDVSFGPFSLGLVLAMACFTGFEACSVLGIEARLPLKMIPRANMLTILIAGFAIIVSAYALVQTFHGLSPALDKDAAPLTTLANSLGLSPIAPFILGGVAFSWFGCLLGCLNTGGRLLYALSRQGLFHKAAARIHAKHNTPHIAGCLVAGTGLGVALALLFNGIGVMDIINYLASFAAFGFLISYIMVSIAAVAYLAKQRDKRVKARRILSAVLAVGLMMIALVGSVYPVPDWPMNILSPLFFCALALGVGYFLYLRKKHPHRLLSSSELMGKN